MPNVACDRTVVDQRGLLPSASFDMSIKAVVTSVDHSPAEPLIVSKSAFIPRRIPSLMPIKGFGCGFPKLVRVVLRSSVGFVIDGRHVSDPIVVRSKVWLKCHRFQ